MRIITCSLLLGLILFSCKDKVKTGPETTYSSTSKQPFIGSDTSNPLVAIDTGTALQMIRHYKNSSVEHYKLFYGSFRFNPSMLADSNRSVKVFAAAYLATDADTSKRNKPTLILQLRYRNAGNSTITYSYFAPESSPLCPPPPECLSQIETYDW